MGDAASAPQPPNSAVARARYLLDLGRHEQAEAELRQALAAEPDDLKAMRLLALTLLITDRPAEMLEVTRRMLASHPEDGDSHRLHGLAMARLGRDVESVTASREAVRKQPANPQGYVAMAHALARTAPASDAGLEAAKKAVELDPHRASSHMVLRNVLVRRGQLAEAEEANLTAIAIDPTNASWRFALAVLRLRMGKLDLARVDIRAVLASVPQQRYLVALAREIERLGRTTPLADVYHPIRAALGEAAADGTPRGPAGPGERRRWRAWIRRLITRRALTSGSGGPRGRGEHLGQKQAE
jgi:tetratricopeptide (TPR) repeat protein